MQKKIWIINHHANNMFFDKGGRHYSIAKYLKRNGYAPIIFCSNAIHGKGESYFSDIELWSEKVEEENNIPFVFIKSCEYSSNGLKRISSMISFYINMVRSGVQYSKKYGKPDCIIASSVHPLAVFAGEKLARILHVSCICEVRDLWPESIFAYYPEKRERWYARILYAGEKLMYKRADKIVMTWPGGKQYVKDRGWINEIGESKIHTISNGVDLECYHTFDSVPDDVVYSFDSKKFNIVYTGSIRKVNNLGVLIDVAKKISNIDSSIQILVFGDGDELEDCRRRCKEEGIFNIEFRGRVPKKYIPEILRRADCAIMHNTSTCLNVYGQSQNKFFEYLAAGVPIIMTYSVNYSICAEEKCGCEAETQTVDKISNVILKMAGLSCGEIKAMREAAFRTAQKYSYEKLTKEYIKIIEREIEYGK